MTSKYVKCDGCGVEVGMQEVLKSGHIHWSRAVEFRRELKLLGWNITIAEDYCPTCAAPKPPAVEEPGELCAAIMRMEPTLTEPNDGANFYRVASFNEARNRAAELAAAAVPAPLPKAEAYIEMPNFWSTAEEDGFGKFIIGELDQQPFFSKLGIDEWRHVYRSAALAPSAAQLTDNSQSENNGCQ